MVIFKHKLNSDLHDTVEVYLFIPIKIFFKDMLIIIYSILNGSTPRYLWGLNGVREVPSCSIICSEVAFNIRG